MESTELHPSGNNIRDRIDILYNQNILLSKWSVYYTWTGKSKFQQFLWYVFTQTSKLTNSLKLWKLNIFHSLSARGGQTSPSSLLSSCWKGGDEHLSLLFLYIGFLP